MLNGTAKKRERNKNKLVALVTLWTLKTSQTPFPHLSLPPLFHVPSCSSLFPFVPPSPLFWLLSHPPYFFAPPLPLLLPVSPHPTHPVWSLLSRTCSWWLPWALLGVDGPSSPQGCRVDLTSSTWPSPRWGHPGVWGRGYRRQNTPCPGEQGRRSQAASRELWYLEGRLSALCRHLCLCWAGSGVWNLTVPVGIEWGLSRLRKARPPKRRLEQLGEARGEPRGVPKPQKSR